MSQPRPEHIALAEHARTLAIEDADPFDDLTDDDVEWSLREMDIDTAEWADDETFVVHGQCETYQSVQRSSGSRTHPPEYENYDVTVRISIEFTPAANDGCGATSVYAEQEGGAPSPPDPEPEWREV